MSEKHNIDAQFYCVHWQKFQDALKVAAIFSDEVILHFHDLGGFFDQSWTLLKPNGMMVHKEPPFTHERYKNVYSCGLLQLSLCKLFCHQANESLL